MKQSEIYRENAAHCVELAEMAADDPSVQRFRRMEQAWLALAHEQAWLDGEKDEPPNHSSSNSSEASAMAGQQIDRMTDVSASLDEQGIRKRMLVKGPEEFRGDRIDRPKTS